MAEELSVLFQFFSTYGYLALALGILFLGDVTLLAAGFFSNLGYFNIFVVVALTCAILPLYDMIFYWLGLTGRKALLFKSKFTQEKFKKVERFFRIHGPKTLLCFRFAFGLRTLFLLVVGMAKMKFGRFYLYDLAGTAIWTIVLTSLGYFFGQSWDLLRQYVRNIGLAITVFAVIIVVVLLLFRKVRKRVLKEIG